MFSNLTDWYKDKVQAYKCYTETCELVLKSKWEYTDGCEEYTYTLYLCPFCKREKAESQCSLNTKNMKQTIKNGKKFAPRKKATTCK